MDPAPILVSEDWTEGLAARSTNHADVQGFSNFLRGRDYFLLNTSACGWKIFHSVLDVVSEALEGSRCHSDERTFRRGADLDLQEMNEEWWSCIPGISIEVQRGRYYSDIKITNSYKDIHNGHTKFQTSPPPPILKPFAEPSFPTR